MIYRIMISLSFLSILTACAPEIIPAPTQPAPAQQPTPTQVAPSPYPQPVTPQSDTQSKNGIPYPSPLGTPTSQGNMIRGEAFVEKSELASPKNSSEKYTLNVSGSLPTPCNQLQTSLNGPDDHNRIVVEVYSLLRTDRVCAQVLVPFQTSIPLGSLKSGKYTVILNGQQVGELTVP
jgi:hypothetical protein